MRLLPALVMIISLLNISPVCGSDYRKALKYLEKYNYIRLSKDQTQDLTEEEAKQVLKEPIKRFKSYYKLGEDDKLDEATEELMKEPRCGNSDQADPVLYRVVNHTLIKSRRFGIISDVPTWVSPEHDFTFPLTIGFKNYSSKMKKSDQEDALLHCASIWAAKSGISFKYVKNQVANIYISFVPSITDDGGKFGVLAKADSPTPFLDPGSSNIEFDEREPWVPKWQRGVSPKAVIFQAVLCHEMGHSLGLDHSKVRGSVMFAMLISQTGVVRLHSDDIAGIQSIYGRSDGKVIVNANAPKQCKSQRDKCDQKKKGNKKKSGKNKKSKRKSKLKKKKSRKQKVRKPRTAKLKKRN